MKILAKPGRKVNRRAFLKRSLAAGGAIAFPWIIPSRALGKDGAVAPGERIALGVIGIGPRCRHVLASMLAEPDAQCVAVCDVQASRCEHGKAMADEKYGNKDCAAYRDFRELLARADIDAVLVATGDRWHALASIMAAKAGKDVYSEKPCAMSVTECRSVAETMTRYARVYQAGTQRRSISNFQLAVDLVRSGKLGRLHTMHASVYRPSVRYDWLPAEPEPPRDQVDWDLWLGPAPWRPYNSQYVSGGWRVHSDFNAGAMILDWGAHTVDLCQWANGADAAAPVEYEPTDANIQSLYANGVRMVMDYLDTPFGDRSPHYRTHLGTCPVRFEGDEGWIETGDSGGIEVHPGSLREDLNRLRTAKLHVGTDAATHARDFFNCVKSRARTSAHQNIMLNAHTACFAAHIAWALKRKISFDPARGVFPRDEEANRMMSRPCRAPWRA